MNVAVFGNCNGQGGAQTAFRRLVDFLMMEGHQVCTIAIGGPDASLSGKDSFHLRIDATAPHLKMYRVLEAIVENRRHKIDRFVSVGLARTSSIIARLLPRTTFRLCQDFISGRALADPLLASSNWGFDALAVQSPSMMKPL